MGAAHTSVCKLLANTQLTRPDAAQARFYCGSVGILIL